MRLGWPASAALCLTLLLLASCGGGPSLNPTPSVTALYPSTVPATLVGAPACTSNPSFTINVQGNNFLKNSVAYWNGAMRNSTFNDATGQLAVTVLACDIATPGVAYVSVTNPPPGGGPSPAAATFQISQPSNPAPSISSLSPASTAAGTLPPGGIVTINGAPAASGSNSPAFISTSQATINGNARATTFVSATELQVQILASDVATAGTLTVSVTNPAPGGGVSSASFTVTDPPNAANSPQVISISASGGAANGASSSPAMSATGRYVAFYSRATNLVASGASGNIFVRDTCVGAAANCTPHTIAVDLAPDGSAPNAAGDWKISISADGRFIAFSSGATNLLDASAEAPSPDALESNVFVRDMCVGSTVESTCSPHTSQVSLGSSGEAPNGRSAAASLSADGRFVAFWSEATNLVGASQATDARIYITDLCTGSISQCKRRTYLASPDNGTSSDFAEGDLAISGNGRYVVFAGIPDGKWLGTEIFLRDTCLGKYAPDTCVPSTMTVSVNPDGAERDGQSTHPSISSDGRFVTFDSNVTSLVLDGGKQLPEQVFLRDTCLGSAPNNCVPTTTSLPAESASEDSVMTFAPMISLDGQYVTFGAMLVPQGGVEHAFVTNTCIRNSSGCVSETRSLSVTPTGELGNKSSYPQIVMSGDGRLIAFGSDATNLASPTSGFGDVFLTLMPTPQR